MQELFSLMPALGSAAVMDGLETERERAPQKKRKLEETPARQKPPGKGEGAGKGRSQKGAASSDCSDLQVVVKQLEQLVLQQAEALNRLEFDTCFLLMLQTSPHLGTVIPAMFKVASAWKEKRASNPQLLTQSLKQVTLVCLIKELATRAEVTFKTPEARKPWAFWKGRLGCIRCGAPRSRRTSGHHSKAVPIADFQAQTETLQKYVMTEGLTRFQALKALTEDLADTQVPFLLDVSLRKPAMQELRLSWAQLGVFGLIGGRLRRSRVRRGPQQEKVYELLQSL